MNATKYPGSILESLKSNERAKFEIIDQSFVDHTMPNHITQQKISKKAF